jgi:hypothetical protein
MNNKKIPTSLGTIVLIIIAVTVFGVVWRCEEKNDFGEIKIQKNNISQQVVKNKQNQEINPEVQTKIYSSGRLVGAGCYEIKDGQLDAYHLRGDFNANSANSAISYENKEFGISFEVPYNKNWGNKDCEVLPYTQRSDIISNSLGVEFGLFRAWTGGLYRFNIGKKRNAEDVIDEQKGGVPNPNPRIETIGKYKVVVHESYGMGTSRIYEVMGDKNNYIFEESQIGSKDGKNNSESSELKNTIKTLMVRN